MIYVAGVNHRTAPLALREKIHIAEEKLPEALADLAGREGVREAVIVSTCNRTELILEAEGPGQAAGAAAGFVASFLPGDGELLAEHGYTLKETAAIRHVFRVASSLDSMIVGEPQILGQVKSAFAAAGSAGTLGPRLSGLMQKSFACAKRVRSETSISRSPVSIASAATDLAEKIFGELKDNSMLILGAGKMGTLTTRHMVSRGVGSVFVSSRTYENGLKLAREFGGEIVPFDQYVSRLPLVDVLVVSTAAPGFVLSSDQAPSILKARKHRPLFIVDLAVPRNVDPALNEVNNIFLYDIDALKDVAESGKAERSREAARAERLVEDEVAGYQIWIKSDQIKPTVVALRQKYQDLVREEGAKIRGKMGELSPDQVQALDQGLNAMINKFLHAPTAELKGLLRHQNGHAMVELTRKLFRLDKETEGKSDSRQGKESSKKEGPAVVEAHAPLPRAAGPEPARRGTGTE